MEDKTHPKSQNWSAAEVGGVPTQAVWLWTLFLTPIRGCLSQTLHTPVFGKTERHEDKKYDSGAKGLVQ